MKIEYIGNNRWRLLESIGFEDVKNDYLVPAGFITDFASIPRTVRVMFKYDTIYSRASVIHDYLYKYKDIDITKRKDADLLFLKIMKKDGVGLIKRHIIYRSVRMFGFLFYKPVGKKHV